LDCDRSGANAVGSQQGFSPVIAASLAAASSVRVFYWFSFFSAIPGFDRGSCVKACAVLVEACAVPSVEASSLSIQTTMVVGLR
jgi:hypothetical protein